MRVGVRILRPETVVWLRRALQAGNLSRAALGRGVCEREEWRNPKGDYCEAAAGPPIRFCGSLEEFGEERLPPPERGQSARPDIRSWVLLPARLAGWRRKQHRKQPGNEVLWRAYRQLQAVAMGASRVVRPPRLMHCTRGRRGLWPHCAGPAEKLPGPCAAVWERPRHPARVRALSRKPPMSHP